MDKVVAGLSIDDDEEVAGLWNDDDDDTVPLPRRSGSFGSFELGSFKAGISKSAGKSLGSSKSGCGGGVSKASPLVVRVFE